MYYYPYYITSCKRSVARRVRVSLTPETVVTIHVLYQNYKACENLLLYIYFKHDISRKSAVQLLLFFVVKRRKITMQWSHVKTFEFVCCCFNCLTSIFFLFCFVFARQILMFLPFSLSFLG